MSSTALIVHGYNLNHSDWLHTMWGQVEERSHGSGPMGRIPTALYIAHLRQPELIIWNTGASEKDGVLEAQYTFEYALEHMQSLSSLYKEFEGVYMKDLADRISATSVLEVESKTTTEALELAISFLAPNGQPAFVEVMQVSSKNHIARVLLDSMRLWWEEKDLRIMTSGYGAETGYAGGTAAEVELSELHPDKRS